MVLAPEEVQLGNFEEKKLFLVEDIQDTQLKLLKITSQVNKVPEKCNFRS